ncbi:3D domain-containing protein [Robertmurraya andreesenii]|uniref:3D (Asp-Asp-Asp) domain-containing protein n=1 Tax=Anoxybacillus andreesenii TaxID=1325932 RepID=A0ABT9V1W2_9BACL|nr:3D domain-containing protein [Robertmurraya andreesenii]MDQ0154942.1 3D (Asp-Asp-Asp) domain-containing protein [Robertmurraya andreesenii]
MATENQRLQDEIARLKATAWQPFEVTAYTAGYESTQKQAGEVGYGITASGTQVTEGRTIACPPSLPFGTVVEIEGIGERVCEDRGGAIKEGHIDVYMADLNEAQSFGRQKRFARIIREAE